MLTKLVDRLGDRNAQLFRELKGRLITRRILIAAGSSLALQTLLIGAVSEERCAYRSPLCTIHFNWIALFLMLTVMMSVLLFAGGAYLTIDDWAREERRGTLNFIRLSPQSSQKILLGKLLGVPALLYLGVAFAIPLHLIAAIAAGIPLGWVASLYLLVGVGCAFCYTTSLLSACLTHSKYLAHQAIAGSVIATFCGSSYIGVALVHFDWHDLTYERLENWKWFVWPVGSQLALGVLWTVATLGVSTYWIWQGLNRRLRNPNATLLRKSQSYGLTASFEIWLLGLFWPALQFSNSDRPFELLFTASILTLGLFLALLFAISPQRQALLDWSRYLQGTTVHQQSKLKIRGSKWRDLVFGEKSPAPLAIAINLAIAFAIWLPWVLLYPMGAGAKMQAIGCLFLSANLIWIYALIAQLFLLSPASKRLLLAAGGVTLAIFLPPTILSAWSVKAMSSLWISYVFGSPWLILTEASAFAIALSFLGQLAAMAGLHSILAKAIDRAGESQFPIPNSHSNQGKLR